MAPLDPGLFRDALAGDPLAQALIHIIDRLEVVEKRSGISAESLQHLAYEAAAGARTEVRKLVEIEARRMWTLFSLWLLSALLCGFCIGWLAHGG